MNTDAASALRFITIAIEVIVIMFAAMIHEVAHGWVAWKLGDPTAKQAGRLTLNPVRHLDPFGSIALPLIMGVLGGPIFAYAKPVPYNPYKLRHPRRDEVLVALAGPLSNICQAFVAGLLFRLLAGFYEGGYGPYFWVLRIISTYVYVNLMLCFFNLIPLPPLDGSKVIMPLLKGSARETYYKIQAYAMPVLFIVLYIVPALLRVDPVGIYLDFTAGQLADLFLGL